VTEQAGWEERLEGGRRERWVWAAYAVGAATAALFLYLGLRPGGMGPIRAFQVGRSVLFLIGAGGLVVGIVLSVLRRPVLQRGRLGAFGCLAAAVWFCAYPLAYPSSHEGHPSAVRYRLPFDAPPADPAGLAWTVRWGGMKGPESALVLQPDRRFGFDFVITDSAGRSASDLDRSADDRAWYCHGATVLAPAAGEVVALHDGEPDAAPNAYPAGAEPLGNYVVLRVAENEYLFLCGLEAGSLAVELGDNPRPGDPIGRVGHSLRSPLTPEPALALHLQDTPEPRRGEGIPLWFRDYLSGDVPVERGVPLGGYRAGRHVGERVRPQP
jgi:hypothetical protein